MAWTKANCTEMEDPNPPEIQQSRQQKDEVWSTIVKMTLILRDLMVGNPELEKLGWKEEGPRPLRSDGRIPGTAPMDGLHAQRRFFRSNFKQFL